MEQVFTQLLPVFTFQFILVFARIGSALLVMPVFSERFVLARLRLMLALLISLIMFPVMQSQLPTLPGAITVMVGLLLAEVLVGLFIGTVARLLLSALSYASAIIGFQTNLTVAMAFNPIMGTQTTILDIFLVLAGVMMILVTDLHHLLLLAIVKSYTVFPVAQLPPMEDFLTAVVDVIAGSFYVGIQLSIPFIIAGLMVTAAIGLVARIVPQVPVFFISMPVQIIVGLYMFLAALGAMMLWFTHNFTTAVTGITLHGG